MIFSQNIHIFIMEVLQFVSLWIGHVTKTMFYYLMRSSFNMDEFDQIGSCIKNVIDQD